MGLLTRSAIVGTALCSALAGPVTASTIYTDRAAFDAATNAATARAFPEAAIGTPGPVYTFNGITFDTTLAGDRAVFRDGLFQNTVYLATGLSGSVTIRSNVNAFGLYLGSADGARSFAYNANGTTGTFTALASTNNAGRFIGFSDTMPLSVRFTTNNELDVVSFVTTSAQVAAAPEPGTWTLMILGFGAVGGVLRRKRATSGRLAAV